MRVHQAYLGDKKGSHNLIASSLEDRLTIGFLKLNTDIPSGINIDYPYLSGYCVEQFYVLTRTMNDPEGERPGMSFSHCILIPLNQIKEVGDLKPIIARFVTSPVKNLDTLPDLDIDFTPIRVTEKPLDFNGLLNQLILNKKTVVYIGYEDFETNISALWHLLPTQMKTTFSFTISGSPNEIRDQHYTLVHSPEIFDTRWSGFPLVKRAEAIQSAGEFNKYLEYPEQTESKGFHQFVQDNKIKLKYIHEFLPVAKLYSLCERAGEKPDIILLKRIIIIVTELIPNPDEGEKLKDQVLDTFTNLVGSLTVKEFMVIRNMTFTAFKSGPENIKMACISWANKNIVPGNTLFFPDGIKLISESFFGETPLWWNEIIQSRFSHLGQQISEQNAAFIWELWKGEHGLLTKSSIVDKGEAVFYKTKGIITDKTIYPQLVSFCSMEKWFMLHADCVSNYLPASEAISAQIKIDTSELIEDHLTVIEQNIGYQHFFFAALTIDNPSVHKIAGKICIEQPSLFSSLNIENLNWQKILLAAFKQDRQIIQSIDQPIPVFEQLLELGIEQKAYLPELVKELALSIGDIYLYQRRKEVWGVFGVDTQGVLLNQTAKYIVENFKSIQWEEIEPILSGHLKSTAFVSTYIINNTELSIGLKAEILEKLSILTDHSMTVILDKGNLALSYFDAEIVARMINKYTLHNTLDIVYDYRHRTIQYMQIVNGCKSMLSKWKRLWLTNNNHQVSISHIIANIDQQKLQEVFELLRKIGVNDLGFNRLRDEYIAGAKGIDLMDLCDRLKTYVQSLG